MRVFLAVAAKQRNGAAVGRAAAAARQAVVTAFPVPADTVAADEWHSPAGDLALLAWSNERTSPDILTRTHDAAVGLNGYLVDPGELSGLFADAGRTGGCFAAFRADRTRVTAVTGMTRAHPVYYAETPELHLVGSRALLVHLVARSADGHRGVEWDELALQSMVRQGYLLSDETPFAGVSTLPAATEISVEDGRRTLTSATLPSAVPGGQRRRGEQVAELAEALITAVRPLRAATEPVALALTGGRDSRLIAATLHAAGVPFTATTYGLEDNPDVVLARRVAGALGVEHRVIPPARSAARTEVVAPHPLDRALDVIRVCEGMTSAYESIVDYGPYSAKPTMSGQSGEILRGGYLSGMASVVQSGIERKVSGLFLGDDRLFTEEANAHAAGLAAFWRERAATRGPETMDHMYVIHRVGRWHAAARAGALRRGTSITPFLDNRVVGSALVLDPLWRRSEAVVHALIAEFCPGLIGIPLQGGPWRFEADAARRSRPGLLQRILRAPEPAAPKPPPAPAGKAWSWRTHPNAELSGILRDGVVGCAALERIVRPERVKALFADGPVRRPALAWHLYTVATMLTADVTAPPPPARESLRIPIPG
ncbi:asparagine synthase-related protein [Rhizohabitans arisaemae]|uniref:asparagine synthase-related protein n=1 Tax=Rhizohabitans arisaemae TaxID=2720610 RepID=UPI0024B223AA|nr:asparagine synthase-related protein [Rhizohabitans arisaemae]